MNVKVLKPTGESSGDIVLDDFPSGRGIVEAVAKVVERVERELTDTVELLPIGRRLLDDVDDVTTHRRMMLERNRDMAIE